MPLALLDAFISGDLPRARGLTDYKVPDDFPGRVLNVLELRRMQLAADPALAPWSARAMVRRDDRVMVGYINFHGAPEAEYRDHPLEESLIEDGRDLPFPCGGSMLISRDLFLELSLAVAQRVDPVLGLP